jgi:tetratricopeptide (TPR) repeat protein
MKKAIVVVGLLLLTPVTGYSFWGTKKVQDPISQEEKVQKTTAHYALETYANLFSLSPALEAYSDYFKLLYVIGKSDILLKIYLKQKTDFDKAFKNNVDVRLTIAQSYLDKGMVADAEKLYLEMSEHSTDNEPVAYFAATALARQGDKKRAKEWLDRGIKNPSLKRIHHLFYFLKSKILIDENKPQDALATIEKSLELAQNFDQALLVKALLLEQLGKINDAIKGYQHFLDAVGHDEMIEKQLVQLLFSQQRYSEALLYLKKIKTNSPDYYYNVAVIEFKANNMKKALANIEAALVIDKGFDKACLLKSEILLKLNQPQKLLDFLESWTNQNPDNVEAIHAFLLLRKTTLDPHLILLKLQDLEQKHPTSVPLLAALADLYLEQDLLERAVQYYEKIVSIAADPLVKAKAYFQVGYVYFMLNQPEKLLKTLEAALLHNPVYPSTYNLLAYHFAQTNQQLSRALTLIEKALAFAPECFYYLDTKGCILLRMGNVDAAVTTFKEALSYAPEDKTIVFHLQEAQGKKG